MKAVLSATATSSVGTTLPRRCGDQRVARAPAPAPSSGSSGPARARRGRTAPARRRRRRTRCARPSTRRALRRRPWRAPWRRHPAARASGLASRISARRSVYFHSSTRRCGRPGVSKRSNAASRSARPRRPAACAFAAAKARRERRLGRRLDRADFGVHRRSRLFLVLRVALGFELERQLLAAGASRCGPSRAHARRPARCSRAAADNA